jgi:hypothetical protein
MRRNQVKSIRRRNQGRTRSASGLPMVGAFLVLVLGGLGMMVGGGHVYQLAADSIQADSIRAVGTMLGGLGLCSMVAGVCMACAWAGGEGL